MNSKILVVCSCVALHGCFCSSFRDYTMVSIADVGDSISTRYRYRITRIEGKLYDHIGFLKEYEINVQDFKAKYPGVFSGSGIPVVIKLTLAGGADKYAWTPLLAMPSLMLFPLLDYYSNKQKVDVTMVDDVAVTDGFVMESVTEGAKSLFVTGLIPFREAPDCGTNRVYWTSGASIGSDTSTGEARREHHFLNSGMQMEEGLAYGVVAKLKELEDCGKIDAMLQRLEAAKLQRQEAAKLMAPAHRVVRLAHNDADGGFVCKFTLELLRMPLDPDKAKEAVLQEFGESLKEEYAGSASGAEQMSLAVNYNDVKMDGKLIHGRATVLALSIVSLSYDANTRSGKLSVRFNAGQFKETREWIRKNIETLARDKNIALTTGQPPPPATYYLLGEKVDGNVMEIEFKTE